MPALTCHVLPQLTGGPLPALCSSTAQGLECQPKRATHLLVQVPRLEQRLQTYLVRFEAAASLADACRVLDAHAAAIRSANILPTFESPFEANEGIRICCETIGTSRMPHRA